MKVSKEKLSDNVAQYESAKMRDSFASTPNLKRTLLLGKMVMGKTVDVSPKAEKAKKLWHRYLGMEAVSRRIYSGCPDYISLRTDYFCSLLMCGDRDIFEAIALLGYLVRYGYWNNEGHLVMDINYFLTAASETGMTAANLKTRLIKLKEHQLLIVALVMEDKTFYKLNTDIVILLNEKDNYFVKENHQQLKTKSND